MRRVTNSNNRPYGCTFIKVIAVTIELVLDDQHADDVQQEMQKEVLEM